MKAARFQANAPRPDREACRFPVRLGLIGCGRLAERGYIPALRQVPAVRLVAVADVDRARCERLAPVGTMTYPDARALVDAGGVDAVIVATPTRLHVADARIASEAGLPVLVEKPPGVDTAEALALANLTPTPWLGFNRRFDPLLIGLKERLCSDSELDLRLEIHYRRKSWASIDMRDDVLLDLGPHLIDLALWFTGSTIERVQTLFLRADSARFRIDLARGSATIRCSNNRPYTERVTITDSLRRTTSGCRWGGVVPGLLARLRPSPRNPLVDSLIGEIQAFARAVRSEPGTLPAKAVDGVVVMACLDALRKSAALGGAVCPVAPGHETQGVEA